MAVYDFLKGHCPNCGEEIGAGSGDIQIKLFAQSVEGECFRTFRPGDKLPGEIADGVYELYPWPFCQCESDAPLYAKVKGGIFEGFLRDITGRETEVVVREPSAVEQLLEATEGMTRGEQVTFLETYSSPEGV